MGALELIGKFAEMLVVLAKSFTVNINLRIQFFVRLSRNLLIGEALSATSALLVLIVIISANTHRKASLGFKT